MIEPYYKDDSCTIYHGDCREVLPSLGRFDLLLTDPPYGIGATRMTLGKGKREFHRGQWDESRPCVGWMVDCADKCCIWGGNYFADQLPITNDWLVWHKGNDDRSFSECELAWTNYGKQTRHLSHHWSGEIKHHPTQKPLNVIRWSMSFIEDAEAVVDPFMGSGTTLLAARLDGRRVVGIELDERYCEIAVNRLAQGVLF